MSNMIPHYSGDGRHAEAKNAPRTGVFSPTEGVSFSFGVRFGVMRRALARQLYQ
jgi:hypothetical protein